LGLGGCGGVTQPWLSPQKLIKKVFRDQTDYANSSKNMKITVKFNKNFEIHTNPIKYIENIPRFCGLSWREISLVNP
jgi:hypothetical protein